MTSTGQASSLTNMFDPLIYATQPLMGTNSNPPMQSMTNETTQQKPPTPTASPQKSKHTNSNTVIPIQTGTLTPQRKQSQPEDGNVRDAIVQGQQHLTQNSGSGASSGNNSRKTSTVSDQTSSETTPENTILTPKLGQDSAAEQYTFSATPTTALDSNQHKHSPVRKLSRFLVSPSVVETPNHELIVQEGSQAPATSPQVEPQQSIEMNINEENYQRMEAPEADFPPQQSTAFRMPETLEQLKIELENITHAHVSTKAKADLLSAQNSMIQGTNPDNDDSHDLVSEAQLESGAEGASMDAVGSIATGENTSVYNSRRTSADMNTNPTDLTSTASGVLEYEENLVSEPVPLVMDDAGPKIQQQMSIDK